MNDTFAGWSALLFLVSGLAACGAGCSSSADGGPGDSDDGDGGDEASCDAFVPGANLLGEDWTDGASVEVEVAVAETVQLVGDVSRGATVLVAEMAHACRGVESALGLAAPPLSEVPTRDEMTTACTNASEGLRSLKTELGTRFQGTAVDCDLEAAGATCLADCSDDATCEVYCDSAVVHLASCPPSATTVTYLGEPPDPPDPRLDGAVVALGDAIGASRRTNALTDAVTSLTSTIDAEVMQELRSACSPLVTEAVTAAGDDVSAAASATVELATLLDGA